MTHPCPAHDPCVPALHKVVAQALLLCAQDNVYGAGRNNFDIIMARH